ncbi:MAG: hypothetical protein LWX83_18265, partial [Anaerolineae bacterium]|nr:hypothetical protein [Anaerolineae bacterium]
MRQRYFYLGGFVLLNLSGLGLGYAVLRHWDRWKNYLLISMALWMLAVLVRAYQNPVLWVILLVLWLFLAMLDAWNLASKTPDRFSAAWLLPVLGLFACLLSWSGFFFYRFAAAGVYERAMQAFQKGDCQSASIDFSRYQNLYRFSLLPVLDHVEKYTVECELLLYSQREVQMGYYEEALNYLKLLSTSSLKPEADRVQVQAGQGWAQTLAIGADYEHALEILAAISASNPDEQIHRQNNEQAAGIIITWGDQLYQIGSYMDAANVYRKVLNLYADTSLAPDAKRRVAAAYFAKAQADYDLKNWSEALSAYQYLQAEFGDLDEVQPTAERMDTLYLHLGESSYAAGDYAGAVQAYQNLVRENTLSISQAELHLKLAQIYAEWAVDLRKKAQYEQAVNIYGLLQNDFGDTPQGENAVEQLPYVSLEWVDDLAYND